MAGKSNKKEKLNNTLLFIIRLLNKNNITNWFIAYGTLLGIIRDNSCIDGDDDIDIITDKTHYDLLKEILINNGFEIETGYGIKNSNRILKTKNRESYCSVDFYLAEIDNEKGTFNDRWENVIWSNCYNEENKLIEYIWNEETLYIPFDYEKKIIGRYGEDWETPKKYKGVIPRKRIL